MGDGFQFLDIILFAMVAAFLVLRLRSVLGRRTGNEKPPEAWSSRPARDAAREPTREPGRDVPSDNVVQLGDRARPTEPVAEGSVAAGIAQIRTADPAFNPTEFAGGARAAFEMIVGAFAAGDTAALRPLLSDEVYENFAEAVRERLAAKETLETRITAIRSLDIVEARLDGRNAVVTVKVVSDQINVTRDVDGKLLDGDEQHAVERTDFWTFGRNTNSSDPNWLLVATGSPH